MKMQMMSGRAKQIIKTTLLATAVLAETIAGPVIGHVLYNRELTKQGAKYGIPMTCKGMICDDGEMGEFEASLVEMILLNLVPAIDIGVGQENDPQKAFADAEKGFGLLENGKMAGAKLLLQYVHLIHKNAFGRDAPAMIRLAMMREYEFEELKRKLGNTRSGLDQAGAFHISENATIYMPPMGDVETTISVIFHELGHGKDVLEYGRPVSEFTSEAIGFYLDLVSCKTIMDAMQRTSTVEGEVYLDKDGMPFLVKPETCRRIPEDILESWIAFMVLKDGNEEPHALGKANLVFEIAERGGVREAVDAIIATSPEDARQIVMGEVVHTDVADFYEKMLEMERVVADFTGTRTKGAGETEVVVSFSFSCNAQDIRDNDEIVRYCQDYAPRGGSFTINEFLNRSVHDANNAAFAHFSSNGFGVPLEGASCSIGFITEPMIEAEASWRPPGQRLKK